MPRKHTTSYGWPRSSVERYYGRFCPVYTDNIDRTSLDKPPVFRLKKGKRSRHMIREE